VASRRRPRDWSKTSRVPTRAADVVFLEFDGEALVYHVRTGAVHRLDRIGSVVWHLLDGEASVAELVNDLSAAFAVEPNVVRDDVLDLLERLDQAFLLVDGPAPDRPVEPSLLINPPSP